MGTNYYHNNVPQPEVLSTSNHVAVGDTITLNSTTAASVTASYLRFKFTSQPPNLGQVKLSDFGPAYGALAGQVTYDALPVPFLIGYGNQFPLLIINVIQFFNFDKYAISGNITKIVGRNALKIGGEAVRNESYLAGGALGPTGLFTFLGGVPTTDIFANFMLGVDIPIPGLAGIGTSRNVSTVNFPQGYYVSDTYQPNPKLTLTGGIRWDLPGGLLEKHDVNTILLPNIASPLGTINNPATGSSQTLTGNLALVNSPSYKSRYDDELHYNLFAPNLGFSWRFLPDTVVRGGYGVSFISYANGGVQSALGSPIVSASTPPTGPLSNPFPQIGGTLPQPPGRNVDVSTAFGGLSETGNVAGAKYPNVQQWNLNFQRQLSSSSALQVGYQGSKGTHIHNGRNIDQLPDSVAAQAATQYQSLVTAGDTNPDGDTFVNVQVANPFAAKLAPGSSFNGPTISKGQLLRPYPQFNGLTNSSVNDGSSIYHSLQVSYQLRFQTAGTLVAAYTWSKLIGTIDSTTGFLEGNTVGGVQDNNNFAAERSIESFDVPQRLVLNYSLVLPVGEGQHLMSNAGAGLNSVIGGWRVSSITSFQTGYPLALTAQGNDLSNSFGAGSIRPNRVPGCNPKISGSYVSRLNGWFKASCFVQPPTPFSFGDESRVDSQLRGEGVDNWDLAISKQTNITESLKLNFETEFLNSFNRVQFSPPALTLGGTPALGVASGTQLNNPREIQFSARLIF
jgi:hypothetical protein